MPVDQSDAGLAAATPPPRFIVPSAFIHLSPNNRKHRPESGLPPLLWPHSFQVTMDDSGIHKYGTDDGWHGKIEEGGEFPPEKDRYHLYIGEQCPVLVSG